MSSSHLVQKINAANLSAKDSKDKREPTTHIFVEGKSDIEFWQTAFERCGLKNIKIRHGVQNKGNGKKVILENLQVAKNLLLCVDSDYDYLLQNATETSTVINDSEFIFQTYSYSIENLFCYSTGIQSILQKAAYANCNIDFEQLMIDYSTIIYPLFLKSVYCEEEFQKKSKTGAHPFSIDSFLKVIVFEQNFDVNYLENIAHAVSEKDASLNNIAIQHLIDRFDRLGVTANNAYLFIQGHHLLNNIVKPLLNKAKEQHDSMHINELKNSYSKEDLGNEIDKYKKVSTKIDELIYKNTEYRECPLYKKIEADIQSYIINYKSLN